MPQVGHFILASSSPRRRELLNILGISFSVVTTTSVLGAEIDESPLPNESPADLVRRLSRIKAEAVAANISPVLPTLNINSFQPIIVIGADTEVALQGKILGKPQTGDEATQMLQALRNQPHDVFSGLTMIYLPQQTISPTPPPTGKTITRLHQSRVWMRPYTDAEIGAYVAGGSPLDKAGAYGIQDRDFTPVDRLEGCFASVMGLPLGELAGGLAQWHISLPEIQQRCSRYTGVVCCQTAGR